jgi:hypothetical protein
MKEEILDFINRRWTKDANWLTGNCYWFAHILTQRFPQLQIYYLPIEGHFVCGDGCGDFYDWTGAISLKESPLLFSKLKTQDPIWYSRLYRDCIK